MFLVSLFLPAIGTPPHDVVPGFFALLFVVVFYPFNLALLFSPVIAASKVAPLRYAISLVLLQSCAAAFIHVAIIDESMEPRSGFWCWLSAFIVSGIGLLIPDRVPT